MMSVPIAISKCKEALVINSEPEKDVFAIQLRIKDRSAFDWLDSYTAHMLQVILVDRTPCKAPHCQIDVSQYVFIHHGKEYRLYHALYVLAYTG